MKTIIPFGNRILVKRRKVGEKLSEESKIYLPDRNKDAKTDIADVIYVPEVTFADKELLDNAEEIIRGLSDKARAGNPTALNALLEFNLFIKYKSIKVGDAIMCGKYVGTTFNTNKTTEELTLLLLEEVIGVVQEGPDV